MVNIAITAGGTSENIDGVRKLTNVSTGTLGWYCLEAVLDYFLGQNQTDFRVYYILTETAVRKELSEGQQQFVEFISVTDAESVYNAVDELTKSKSIDYFIHSMAISDFTFAYVISNDALEDEIQKAQASIKEILENPKNKYSVDVKIPSDERVVMGLKRTKKVIPVIKQNNANTVLVGFKLLKEVSENELMNVARELAEKNGCDLVFANELSRISDKNHTGMLMKGDKIVARPVGKKQIAQTIVREMMSM